MDINLLIDEILSRVSEHLAGVNAEKNTAIAKAKVLVLAENHGTICHELLEASNLKKYYQIDCALESQYKCNLNDYEAVIIYNLTIDALSKLANGICDTPFISLASKAILIGKKIFIPIEEVELYNYKVSAPCAYYSMMNEKIKLLIDSGVTFCKNDELELLISKEHDLTESNLDVIKQDEIKCIEITRDEIKSRKLNKKIITEVDIRKLFEESVKRISINSNAILTDLAKEYIHNKKIELIREPLTDGKLRKDL